jgi:TM2 domain-containing membrane protein YozV
MTNDNKNKYLSGLTAEQQTMFLVEAGRLHKSETTALFLTLFLGGIGAHRFYLRQKGLGILYAVFCWTLIPAVAALCELFVISRRVRQYNERVNSEVATALRVNAAPRADATAPAAELLTYSWAYREAGNYGSPRDGGSGWGYLQPEIYSPFRRSTGVDQAPGERRRLNSQIYPAAVLRRWEPQHLSMARP